MDKRFETLVISKILFLFSYVKSIFNFLLSHILYFLIPYTLTYIFAFSTAVIYEYSNVPEG